MRLRLLLSLLLAPALLASAGTGLPRLRAAADAEAAQVRDTPARRQGNASIRGVVVDGMTGAPIRRAAVSLVIEEPDREGSRVEATTADANGQFEFTGVPGGRVQVTASRVGYFDYDNIWNGEPEEPQWQTIAPGQRIQGVRIALYRGGVVAGRVLDEFGEPAVGVEIDVLRREPGNRGGGVRTTSSPITPTTDDTGAFRVWGLAPGDYIVGARPELVPALKDSLESSGGSGRRRVTLRDALVVGQLALSLVLLVSGALLARGLVVARSTDLGFDPSRVAYLVFSPQMNGYDTDRAMALRARALDAVKAVPGVTAASFSTRLPLGPDINMNSYAVPGRHDADDDGVSVDTTYVGADYFTVMGIPLVEGRGFTEDEATNDRQVVVINETFAKTYWPGDSAVGRVVHNGGLDQPAFTIVGVSRDHKVRSAGEAPMPYAHLPIGRGRSIELVVRTAGPAGAVMPALKQAVWALEPDAVFTAEGAASAAVEATLAPTRIGAAIIGVVGVLALLLAAVGLYGVTAYSVSLRTREVGIRLALGAERGQVLRMVLGQGARLALVGIGLGAALAAAAASVLQSMLYGVSAIDPLAYGAAALLLLVVALAANLAPAITASRVAPATAIRG